MTRADESRLLVNLRWMQRLNDEDGIGYLGPSLTKFGPIEECEVAVSAGFARRDQWSIHRPRRGYWITDEGRVELERLEALK